MLGNWKNSPHVASLTHYHDSEPKGLLTPCCSVLSKDTLDNGFLSKTYIYKQNKCHCHLIFNNQNKLTWI